MGICQVPKMVIGSKNTEQGSLKIYGKDADALILGDATHEGGDVKIYRDTSGNLQLSLDADAASNALALSVYGGVVAQNYLTVGQAALNTTYPLYVVGAGHFKGTLTSQSIIYGTQYRPYIFGATSLPIDINIPPTDAATHQIRMQIDEVDILIVQATGDGAGGLTAQKNISKFPLSIEAPADANALLLGHATQEGGDIIVYRDASGNAQLTLDADAASNAKALSVYGGLVAQNYLTVGQTALSTSHVLEVIGDIGASTAIAAGGSIFTGSAAGINIGTLGIKGRISNQANLPINIDVASPDAIDHAVKLQIDANDIFIAQATGDGSGGVTNLKAIAKHPLFIEAPADANALLVGNATQEGGDIIVYRDASGNVQLTVDADAASNAKALDVYGGVVAQHYLTVGTTALNTTYPLALTGNMEIISGNVYVSSSGKGLVGMTNISEIFLNIIVGGADVANHALKLRIDSNDIFVVQATGNGAGGIDAATKAIGFFGVTPQVQQNHIADPTDLASCISALSTLLADLEGYGLLKAS